MLLQKLRKLRIIPQRVPQIYCATVIRLPRRVWPPHRLTPSVTNPIIVEYVSATPMFCEWKFHQLLEVVLWPSLSTVAHDEMWPHSRDARKYSWKHLKSEFIWLENCKTKATMIIWERCLGFLAVTDIMRRLWNYRTDFHCSSCWQTLLSWGCGRTTDQSHMEYAEMLLCRNRRCFNSSCRIKSPDVNTMLTEANRSDA